MENNIERLAVAVATRKLSGSDLTFAASLLAAATRPRGLSEKQRPWVDKLVARAEGTAAPKPVEQLGSVAAIFALFQRAKNNGLKYPKIRLQTIDRQHIVFQQSGERSKYAGQVQITDGGRYPSNRYFGRIDSSGILCPGRDMTADVRAVVDAFADNPAKVASEYGRLTGACCFCQRTLTTEESVAVGYGPVCADKFGLPWGN